MFAKRTWLSMTSALVAGLSIGWFLNHRDPVWAAGNTDRHEDFVMATGPINQGLSNNTQFLQAELDGVWILDYKSGKLLATTMNRITGKTIGFGEVDLVKEFEIAPRANVHFVMSTGMVVRGQSVLYLVETTTGKLGVYSMVQSETTTPGMTDRILIRRHDMVNIRTNATPPPVDVQNLTRPIQPLAPMPGSVPQQPVLPNIPAMQPPIIPQPN
ncbi:MAG TPA: hypothetical protein PKD72_03115, partial [Gemmatales bacterium]|nr:hypothetical protein [Gemmatales bacterium]